MYSLVVPMYCICTISVLSLRHLCTASVLPLSPPLLYLVLYLYSTTSFLPLYCNYLCTTTVLHFNYLCTASVLHHYVCTTSIHYLFLTVVLPPSYLFQSLCTCIGCEKLARSSPFSSQVALKQRRLLLSSSKAQNFNLFCIHTWHCCVTPIKSESGPELQPRQAICT